MALTTITLSNSGSPLHRPDGTVLAGADITFTLVNQSRHPVDAWDNADHSRVGGSISTKTDENGEFSVNLWPNDRGDRQTFYLCEIEFDQILGQVTGTDPLDMAAFTIP